MKEYKIAKVTWEDSSHYRDTVGIEWYREDSSSLIVSTVGFVLRGEKEGCKKSIVIAQEVNEDDRARDVTVIPKRMIIKVEYLKK